MSWHKEDIYAHVRLHTTKEGSWGTYTLCHTCEPADQSIDWSTHLGKLVYSTGTFCTRDDTGAKVSLPKNAPTLAHAMTEVALSETDNDKKWLGVVCTVEDVQSNFISHPHGGVVIRSKFTESDDFKVLRVASSGDCQVRVAGNGASGQNVSVGDLITSSDVRKSLAGGTSSIDLAGLTWDNDSNGNYVPAGALYMQDGPPRTYQPSGASDKQVWRRDHSGYTFLLYSYGNHAAASWMIIKMPVLGADTAAEVTGKTVQQLNYTGYYSVSSGQQLVGGYYGPADNMGAWSFTYNEPQSWEGGFLQRQADDSVKSSTVCKALMDVDFSNDVATLQQTFSGVEEWVAEDGLTYRSCLLPSVFV